MNCKYSSYSADEDRLSRQRLYCSITKEMCPLIRYCGKVGKFINTDYYKECRYYNMENNKVKNGFSAVRFEKRGKLYVEVGNQVLVFDNPYDTIPKEVEIVNVKGKYYIKGTEPKQQKSRKELDDLDKELLS